MTQFPQFNDPSLWLQAITHSSYANEHQTAGCDNERLEFLGDAILKFCLSRVVYERCPHLKEGGMTLWRSQQEQNSTLAQVAVQIHLDRELRLGKGTQKQGGRQNQKILSGALEAVIGAYFLDSGIQSAQDYVELLLPSLIE